MKLIFFFLFLISQILGQNKIYESKDVIISYENPNLETIVFWGGIGYATPQWLESKIEKKYFKKYNIILVSYNIELEFIKKIFLEKTSQELKPEIILGFSRGGLLAQQYHTKDYKIVGLIDPVLNFKKKFAYCQNIIFVRSEEHTSELQSH